MNCFKLRGIVAGLGLTAALTLTKRENHAMFRKATQVCLTALAVLALTATSANAAITIVSQTEGFVDSTKTKIATAHLGTTLLSYNATGVNKLVLAIGTEAGFNNQSTNVTGLTFNGVAFTQAVEERTYLGDRDGGTAEIWYLDNPFQGSATFGFTATSSSGGINGGHASIIGLSGTADGTAGIGATAAAWTNVGPVTSSITTTAIDSLVIAMVENSGNNNAAGTPNVVSPLILSNNGVWGSQWGSAASGYQYVSGPGTTITPTFTTNTGDKYSIHTVAAEFLVAVPTLYWDIDGATPGAGGVNGNDPAGTWDASTNWNWNASSDGGGTGTVAWSAGNTAVFAAGTTANGNYTVTVDGTQDITGLKFEEGTVTLAPALTGGALRLTGNSIAYVASGLTATVETPISEDIAGRQLFKTGTGTLVLSGDLTHTGLTTVAAGGGTLILSGNNVAATGGMSLNGGVTQFDSAVAINGAARNVTVNAGGTVVFGSSFGAGNIPSALLNRIVASSAGVIAADN
jgi:autotransporter-associated beta strand protein